MKKALFLLPFLFLLFSCDNISEDDRYIEVAPILSQRKVLLEEFTGQRCTNCPAAHAIIEKLEEQYGDELIVVSIHAGSFGIASPTGLMQPEGDVYAGKWGVSAYPCGVIDRSGEVLVPDAWAAAIRNEMGKDTPVGLDLEAALSSDGHSIDITTTLYSSEPVKGSLQLWVTENDIVGFQIDGSQRLQDYVHNNVFRACVNGTWGEAVEISPNVFLTSENSIGLDEEWNVENLYIVGFLYNETGVMQVNRCKVSIINNNLNNSQ